MICCCLCLFYNAINGQKGRNIQKLSYSSFSLGLQLSFDALKQPRTIICNSSLHCEFIMLKWYFGNARIKTSRYMYICRLVRNLSDVFLAFLIFLTILIFYMLIFLAYKISILFLKKSHENVRYFGLICRYEMDKVSQFNKEINVWDIVHIDNVSIYSMTSNTVAEKNIKKYLRRIANMIILAEFPT